MGDRGEDSVKSLESRTQNLGYWVSFIYMYSIAELKPGRAIIFDGDPYMITWSQFSKAARQGGVMATKMKNLITGSVVQKTFQGSEKIQPADVGYRKVQYLYGGEGTHTFMDLQTYDQFELTDDILGDSAKFLMDGQEVDAQVFQENPIGIKIPSAIDMKVKETIPGVRGDTATGGTRVGLLLS